MKKNLFILLACVLMCACQHAPVFHVSGTIAGAEGETVYLEHTGLIKVTAVDSATVKKDGSFSLKATAPEYPDLYRLRVDGRQIVLAVDSSETIGISADIAHLLQTTFTGSDKSAQIQALRNSLISQTPEEHKEFARQTILDDPRSIVAYYALFQTLNGSLFFDFSDRYDRRCYQAVATSFQVWMPEYERTKILCSQVIESINAERRIANEATMQEYIQQSENSFLEITLKNENGEEKSLSEKKGKVTILSFSSLQIEQSKGYIFELRELYNDFHSRGLEIYEVYPDPNRLVWEDQVRELPWTTVRTENGLLDPVYATYNVQVIPTLYLYNKKGDVVGRFGSFEELRKAISKEL